MHPGLNLDLCFYRRWTVMGPVRKDLLIVNEALSSLDTTAERRLIEKVRTLMESHGILWILGRVQLAELFNVVIVMERGRLVDKGPYESIQSGNEQFRQLLEAE